VDSPRSVLSSAASALRDLQTVTVFRRIRFDLHATVDPMCPLRDIAEIGGGTDADVGLLADSRPVTTSSSKRPTGSQVQV
jgi:hypothetical protein